jgi:hypothetical protein
MWWWTSILFGSMACSSWFLATPTPIPRVVPEIEGAFPRVFEEARGLVAVDRQLWWRSAAALAFDAQAVLLDA